LKRVCLLAALLLGGCHVETDSPVVKAPAPAPPVAVKDEPKATPPKTAAAPLRHPDRVYQLAELATTKLQANGTEIDAWVMDDDGKRMEGMMFLKDADVPERQGMIFVFPSIQDKDRGFWMQNTYVPLDIIYIGTDKRVVTVGVGKPLDETSVRSTGDYQYVLELKQGTAAKLGIKSGTQIDIPPTVTAEA
jgi:uncharacterized membrane protein (UPF0127 family)